MFAWRFSISFRTSISFVAPMESYGCSLGMWFRTAPHMGKVSKFVGSGWCDIPQLGDLGERSVQISESKSPAAQDLGIISHADARTWLASSNGVATISPAAAPR